MTKYLVGITWKEIVEHYGSVEVEAENEDAAKDKAAELSDRGEIDFKVIDGEFWSGYDYDVSENSS